MKLLDANAILRYVLNDNEEQAKVVSEAVRNGSFTTVEVLAEVVYVLSGVYKVDRNNVSRILHCILLDIEIDNPRAIKYAIGIYDQSSLDFVDCLLIAYHKTLGLDILSFDKKLNSGLSGNFQIFQL
ncbi:MAG: PIN domain-containing protein [Sphaerochaetaceae bacterium]|nr:PIN domain-containing protein [Sphaerochaetaceae bacterium]